MGEVRGVLAFSKEGEDCEDVLTLLERYGLASDSEFELLYVDEECVCRNYLIAEILGVHWISFLEKTIESEQPIEFYSSIANDDGADYYFSLDRKGNKHMARFDSEASDDDCSDVFFAKWRDTVPLDLFDNLSAYL